MPLAKGEIDLVVEKTKIISIQEKNRYFLLRTKIRGGQAPHRAKEEDATPDDRKENKERC